MVERKEDKKEDVKVEIVPENIFILNCLDRIESKIDSVIEKIEKYEKLM